MNAITAETRQNQQLILLTNRKQKTIRPKHEQEKSHQFRPLELVTSIGPAVGFKQMVGTLSD